MHKTARKAVLTVGITLSIYGFLVNCIWKGVRVVSIYIYLADYQHCMGHYYSTPMLGHQIYLKFLKRFNLNSLVDLLTWEHLKSLLDKEALKVGIVWKLRDHDGLQDCLSI